MLFVPTIEVFTSRVDRILAFNIAVVQTLGAHVAGLNHSPLSIGIAADYCTWRLLLPVSAGRITLMQLACAKIIQLFKCMLKTHFGK